MPFAFEEKGDSDANRGDVGTIVGRGYPVYATIADNGKSILDGV